VICPFHLALQTMTTRSCIIALFNNDKELVHKLCDFRFIPGIVQPQMLEISPTSVIVYHTPLIAMICPEKRTMLTGCTYCIIRKPCSCDFSTQHINLPARLTACDKRNVSVTHLHLVNLAVMMNFFNGSQLSTVLADTTFPRPLTIKIPDFRIYNHSMKQIIATDSKTHLSLKKMAATAKARAVTFSSLTEPLLTGDLNIDTGITIASIIAFTALAVATLAMCAVIWLIIKLRALKAALLILSMTRPVNFFDLNELPKFNYPGGQLPIPDLQITDHNSPMFILTALLSIVFAVAMFKLFWHTCKKNCTTILLEITNGKTCVCMSIMDLHICPAYLIIRPPTSITDVQIINRWVYHKLNLKIHGTVLSINNEQVNIPQSIYIKPITAYKLSRILRGQFCAYLLVSHNGLMTVLSDTGRDRLYPSCPQG
jgi:hypothetical protein